jgi:hypothetical protein
MVQFRSPFRLSRANPLAGVRPLISPVPEKIFLYSGYGSFYNFSCTLPFGRVTRETYCAGFTEGDWGQERERIASPLPPVFCLARSDFQKSDTV